jgi:MtaA/CmuA family methyltransferase
MELLMTSYERVKTTIEKNEPDRVPVFPSIVAHAARIYGITYKEFCTSAEMLAKATMYTTEFYGLDGIFIQADGWTEAEAVGVELIYPEDNAPSGKDKIVKNRVDLKRLRIPDPYIHGRMPIIVEANKLVVHEIGKKYFIKSQIDQSPFALACELRGFEQVFLDIYDDPDFLHTLLDFCTEVQIAYGLAIAETGIHSIFIGEAIGSQVSPGQYEEFLLPYNSKVIEAMKKKDVFTTLHTCGDSTHNIKLMAESGADIIEFDCMVDIAWAKREVGNKTCLQGNISTSTLLMGTQEEVDNEAKQCIQKAANGGGFLLSPGCEPSPLTPKENIIAMVKAAEKYGKYPIRLQEKVT